MRIGRGVTFERDGRGARLVATGHQPGASFDYRFRPPMVDALLPRASRRAADGGLYGALIVEARAGDADREIGSCSGCRMPRPHAPTLVNGVLQPEIAMQAGERVRLRLINATGMRGYLEIHGHTP